MNNNLIGTYNRTASVGKGSIKILLGYKKWGCLGFICILLSLQYVQAQTRGKLEIIKDPRIDSLIAHRYSTNKAGGGRTGTSGAISTFGYRVQFFSGPNRKEAFNAQNKFQQLHPEMRTYITYSEPNFKVKGGDFRSRLEAAKLMQELRGHFISMFIIPERINLPKLADSNTPQ